MACHVQVDAPVVFAQLHEARLPSLGRNRFVSQRTSQMPTDNPGDFTVGKFFTASRVDRRFIAESFGKPQGCNSELSRVGASNPVHGQVRKRVPDYAVTQNILAM